MLSVQELGIILLRGDDLMNIFKFSTLFFLIILILTGCSSQNSENAGSDPIPPSPSFSPTNTPVPSPTQSPAATPSPQPTSADLIFIPDQGFRIETGSNPAPGIDPETGVTYLYYSDGPDKHLATSEDGINFVEQATPTDCRNDPRRLLLPDGKWRLFEYDQQNQEMKSRISDNGLKFTNESGSRYQPQENDKGSIGVYDIFTNSRDEVVMLYIGDMTGLNNVRRAYSADNGWTFTFQRGNVLGDDNAGGNGNSHVDQKSILLPDGRRRLFTMKQGPEPPQPPAKKVTQIFSFISEDDGDNFTEEPGTRITPEDFREFDVYSLHDPWVVLMKDGRYRMYVCARVYDGNGGYKFAIVSATTQ